MYTFLFDILPDTGHIRITLQLASLLHQKGHEVYYTDSSDSVFTDELIDKGIGRVYYPGDFRFFIPDMVLLDYALKEKAPFYREHNIKYAFVTMQLLSHIPENNTDIPVICLPPSAHAVPPSDNPGNKLSDWLLAAKKDEDNIIIIGLLEEGEYPAKPDKLYETIKKSCITNAQYQIVLLTNNKQSVGRLFPLPDNMVIYRSINLSSVLPLCDVALITGHLNTMIEGIQANVPAIIYPVSEDTEHNHSIERYTQYGLGICSQTKRMTPKIFEQQIAKVIQQKKEIKAQLQGIKNSFENENLKLKWVIDWLIKHIQ